TPRIVQGAISVNKKSVWAIVAGAVVIIVVTTAIDVALHLVGFYPPMGRPIDDWQAVVGTSYPVVIGIAGGWLTARLPPNRPMRHAMILGILGAVLGSIGLLATWNKDLGPRWYAIAHVVLAIPETWLGAKLAEVRAVEPATVKEK